MPPSMLKIGYWDWKMFANTLFTRKGPVTAMKNARSQGSSVYASTSKVTIKSSSFLTLNSMSLVRRGLNIDCSMPQATMLQSKIRNCRVYYLLCTLVSLLTTKRLFLSPSPLSTHIFAPPSDHPHPSPLYCVNAIFNHIVENLLPVCYHTCKSKLVLCQQLML